MEKILVLVKTEITFQKGGKGREETTMNKETEKEKFLFL